VDFCFPPFLVLCFHKRAPRRSSVPEPWCGGSWFTGRTDFAGVSHFSFTLFGSQFQFQFLVRGRGLLPRMPNAPATVSIPLFVFAMELFFRWWFLGLVRVVLVLWW
jgi:hypothetical protein